MSFKKERKLETGRKVSLATELGLDPKQVAVWFQNRRARHKSKQLEEEYMKLKSAHDSVVVEKCHLENEVLPFLLSLSLFISVIAQIQFKVSFNSPKPSFLKWQFYKKQQILYNLFSLLSAADINQNDAMDKSWLVSHLLIKRTKKKLWTSSLESKSITKRKQRKK